MLNLRLLFVALAWGVNFSAVKYALTDFHPLGFTVVRFTLASMFLFAVMFVKGESFFIEKQHRLAVVKLGFTGITLYNLFFIYGLERTTAANSALLISLSPLCGAVVQSVAGRERLTARIAAGLTLSLAGVLLIVASHAGTLRFSPSGMTGDLLTLAATLTWAFYTIKARPLLEKHSAVAVTAYAMAAGSILLLPLSLPGLIAQPWSSLSPMTWSATAFAAFIAGGIAYVFWYEGVKRLGVTRTMVYHYLMPFAAVLFSALALGERLALLQVLGGILILSGVRLVQSQNSRTGAKSPDGRQP